MLFTTAHCRVILSNELEGKVGERLAAARIDPETGKGVTGFLADDVSPLIQAVDPVFLTRKVTSPRW